MASIEYDCAVLIYIKVYDLRQKYEGKGKFRTDKRDKRHNRGGLRQIIGKIVCLGRNNQECNQRRTFEGFHPTWPEVFLHPFRCDLKRKRGGQDEWKYEWVRHKRGRREGGGAYTRGGIYGRSCFYM